MKQNDSIGVDETEFDWRHIITEEDYDDLSMLPNNKTFYAHRLMPFKKINNI